MAILDKALGLVGLQRKPVTRGPMRRRSYAAGASNRLYADWTMSTLTADRSISDTLRTIIARSRQLENDNRYYRRWLSSIENNVLGSDGINMQSKAKFERSGRFDVGANRKIEAGWANWGKPENCSLNREDGWLETQRVALRSTARDGGLLVQIKRGRDLNQFGFTINLMEIDLLDITYTEALPNGNDVRLGVERNRFNQVVAYHLLKYHPGDLRGYNVAVQPRDRMRLDAFGTNPNGDEILHYYVKSRVMQSVGIPWGCASMTKLHHLDQYEQAELMQSRFAAAKGMFFTNERGEEWKGDEQQETSPDGNDESTNIIMDSEALSMNELPPGVKPVPFDLQHPNQAYKDYVVALLHGIASGLDIDYATLTGDLSQNSFSSTKAGRLEVQEGWKKIQGHFIQNFCLPIFGAWLEMAMLTGQVPLPMRKYDELNKPKFRGRRWPWVDPQKDIAAAATALEINARTLTDIIAENGGDFEDVVEQRKLEKEMMAEAGLIPTTPKESTQEPQEEEDPQNADSQEEPMQPDATNNGNNSGQ